MKFCTDCGSKVNPSNGTYPKFCAECGNAFGVKNIKKVVYEEPEEIDEMSLQSLDFSFSSEEESILKIENLMGSSENSDSKKLNRAKSFASIEELRTRMKQNSVDEA
jgi:hypothetical protein